MANFLQKYNKFSFESDLNITEYNEAIEYFQQEYCKKYGVVEASLFECCFCSVMLSMNNVISIETFVEHINYNIEYQLKYEQRLHDDFEKSVSRLYYFPVERLSTHKLITKWSNIARTTNDIIINFIKNEKTISLDDFFIYIDMINKKIEKNKIDNFMEKLLK
jgi:hypothetical protein